MIVPDVKKYLPSSTFVRIIGVCLVVVVLVLVVTSRIGSNSSFNGGTAAFAAGNGTVADAITKDSNDNGIPDWEETLYGLDPTADGATNKKIIEEKMAAAGISTADDDSAQPLTETDKFSQELLSTILALQQSGNLTPEAITNLASSVGDTVDAKHVNTTPYVMTDLTLYPLDTAADKAEYKKELKAAIDQYSDVDFGSELSIIANAMDTDGGDSALAQLQPIAAAYTSLGAQIIKLKTPPGVAQDALDLANSSAAMGETLGQVQNFYTDVLAGMVGIDDYIKANTLSDQATNKLSIYFSS